MITRHSQEPTACSVDADDHSDSAGRVLPLANLPSANSRVDSVDALRGLSNRITSSQPKSDSDLVSIQNGQPHIQQYIGVTELARTVGYGTEDTTFA